MGKKRFGVALCVFGGNFCTFVLRGSFSVTTIKMMEEFHWQESTKGYILSSYFWGYIIPQTIGGIVATQYGAAPSFGLGVFLASVLCLLVPFFGSYPTMLIILNAISGVINAFVCPSVSALMAKWAPVNERTLLTAIAYAGSPLGLSLGQPICGFICDRAWGWRGVYYVIFALHLVWYIWFYLYVSSSPAEDKHISEDEKRMIITSIEEATREAEMEMARMDRASEMKRSQQTAVRQVKTKKNKGKKYIKVNEDMESSSSSDNEGYDADQDTERSGRDLEEANIPEGTILSPESPTAVKETSSLIRKSQPEIKAIQTVQTIEFNNTRSARVSRISLGPIQMIPPELEMVKEDKKQKIPWKVLVTNAGVLSLVQLMFGVNWAWYTMMTYLPTYINGMFKLTVTMTSIISIFPYMSDSILEVVSSFITDCVIQSGSFKIVTIRKFFVVLGNLLAGAGLMAAALSKNVTIMIILMSFAVGSTGITLTMIGANMMDISPHYSGIIMGISNTVGTLPGIISPILTSYIIGEKPTSMQWNIVFGIATAILVLSAALYSCFAKGISQRGL